MISTQNVSLQYGDRALFENVWKSVFPGNRTFVQGLAGGNNPLAGAPLSGCMGGKRGLPCEHRQMRAGEGGLL